MNVLIAITYYRPHVSGLTIYVERLAEGLASRGHGVTVLTSRFDPGLPRLERADGVQIVRVPVAARVSKGVLMPTFGMAATRLLRTHDVLSIHLPQLDAPGLTVRGHAAGRPAILTYHCDLQLPHGTFNRVVDQVVFGANYVAASLANKIVAYTRDYAENSRLLSRFLAKVVVIPPPVVMPAPARDEVADFCAAHLESDGPVIGFAARLAAEKGVEHLVRAMPGLVSKFPGLKVLFAGPYENVLGEEAYRLRLQPEIDALGAHWQFLGTLAPAQMPGFFGACDVLVVPSLNSTESFGLVQVEAMLCGTPVVASNLPGVRQPVKMTGMGEVVAVGDTEALADGIVTVLENKTRYVRPRSEIEKLFDLNQTLSAYEVLFEEEIAKTRHASARLPAVTPKPIEQAAPPFRQHDYFERHLAEMPLHRAVLRSVEAKLMSQVPLCHPILDLGTGDGHFAAVSYGEPIDVGVDILWRDLKEAAARPGVYRGVARASATGLPFRDGAFNTVVSNCVIEHIPDLDATLSEIARVLAPGGMFATTLPSQHFADYLLGSTLLRRIGLRGLSRLYGEFFNRISHHCHVYPPEVWAQKLKSHGLHIVQHRYYFSPAAHRAFDLSHYLSVPNLISRGLTGKWVLHPAQMWPFGWWLRRYYEEPLPAVGAYQFVRCEKRASEATP